MVQHSVCQGEQGKPCAAAVKEERQPRCQLLVVVVVVVPLHHACGALTHTHTHTGQAQLSHLAHQAVKVNKYRPETCCVIGNYYSLRGDHERAVTHFRRALAVDRRFLAAWTLMGHEYVEMKNTAAAIQVYRRAVDINPKDYRAW